MYTLVKKIPDDVITVKNYVHILYNISSVFLQIDTKEPDN